MHHQIQQEEAAGNEFRDRINTHVMRKKGREEVDTKN